jgi:hypothetical protein
MKHIFMITVLIIGVIAFSAIGFTQENNWEQEFVTALQKGKAATDNQGGGLGYTPSEETALAKAIKQAMKMKAPSCQAMKIAVDMKYKPYSVIKNIFGYGSQIDLDQLCMCATETGINKQIIAKAASDATSPLGNPIYNRDEITQSQCLKEIGLGYTNTRNTETPVMLKRIVKIAISPSGPTAL